MLALVVLAACLAVLAASAQAATIEVSTTEDPTGTGSCPGSPCSLRQAVAAAAQGDTIQLAGAPGSPAEYALTQGTPIVVDKSITIAGDGIDESVIDGKDNVKEGGAQNRILKLTGGNVQIEGVGFTGGMDGEDENFNGCNPCYTITANGGGAIFNAGATLTLDEDAFVGDGRDSSQPVGGAIANDASLEMEDVIFQGDTAALGGALFARSGSISANRVTFAANGSDGYDGGAMFLYGGSASFTNTTIVESGWAASFGGGIDNYGANLTLTNDTLSENIRGSLETDVGATTTVENTILGSGFADNSDYDCVAEGKGNDAGTTTAKAITDDLGHNIDQDGVCGLDAAGDRSGVDPKLVPPAENGGFVSTQALLHGSPALEGANPEGCPLADARGVSRPQGGVCDVGAFEAELVGAPSAKTEPADEINSEQEELAASIRLDGEAGGFHFLWGTSPEELVNETPEAPAGVVSGEDFEIYDLGGLSPETTYYYKAVADNASGSTPAENVLSFTTPTGPPGPPVVSSVTVLSVTTTTATLQFTIDPAGSDTSYVIDYGRTTGYGKHTPPVDVGATEKAKTLTATLEGLEPSRTYHFDVLASNEQAPEGVASEDHRFTTKARTSGEEEAPKGGEEGGSKGEEKSAKGEEGHSGEGGSKGGEGSSTPGSETPPAQTASTASTNSGTGQVLGASSAHPAATPLPAPVLGKTVDVEVVGGKVFVALPAGASASLAAPLDTAVDSAALEPAFASLNKGLHFVPLSEARQIPVGSTLEATAGVARITTATATVGKTQSGEFGAGIFKLLQGRRQKGLTELDIVDNRSAKQACASLGKKAAIAAGHLSGKALGRLTGSAHGSFSTHGQYSASTVRGTVWSVTNQCDGTLTQVTRGVVSVRDFRKRKTITLFAGQHYLARASG